MDRRAWLSGILLVGASFLFHVDVPAQNIGDSGTDDSFDVYDYPHAEDDNWSNNSSDPCRNVTRGSLGGTRDWEWKSDAELREAVECQLSKRPFVNMMREKIDVSVQDGTAVLSGTVRNEDSIRSAIVDAYRAGVKDVVSKLEVEE